MQKQLHSVRIGKSRLSLIEFESRKFGILGTLNDGEAVGFFVTLKDLEVAIRSIRKARASRCNPQKPKAAKK